MKVSIRFTYNTVTPESAAEGDFERHGYCDCDGSIITETQEELDTVNDEDVELWLEPGDIAYYINKACDLGINEDVGHWFQTSDQTIHDYGTCEEWTYNLHIEGITDEQRAEIARILKSGNVSSDDYKLLETFDMDIQELYAEYTEAFNEEWDELPALTKGLYLHPDLLTLDLASKN